MYLKKYVLARSPSIFAPTGTASIWRCWWWLVWGFISLTSWLGNPRTVNSPSPGLMHIRSYYRLTLLLLVSVLHSLTVSIIYSCLHVFIHLFILRTQSQLTIMQVGSVGWQACLWMTTAGKNSSGIWWWKWDKCKRLCRRLINPHIISSFSGDDSQSPEVATGGSGALM